MLIKENGGIGMKITGTIEFNNNGALSEEKVSLDTEKRDPVVNENVYEAVSFALYGKTVFHDIVRPETGVPMISLSISCGDKKVAIVRQPQYVRETAMGSNYLTKELFSFSTDDMQYGALSSETYYQMIHDYLDMSYEKFVGFCRASR